VALDTLGDMAPPIAIRIGEEHDFGLETLDLKSLVQVARYGLRHDRIASVFRGQMLMAIKGAR
jgi:hypothetical protein